MSLAMKKKRQKPTQISFASKGTGARKKRGGPQL
jgi:hypothetical protein